MKISSKLSPIKMVTLKQREEAAKTIQYKIRNPFDNISLADLTDEALGFHILLSYDGRSNRPISLFVDELWRRYKELKKDKENPYRNNRGKIK